MILAALPWLLYGDHRAATKSSLNTTTLSPANLAMSAMYLCLRF